MNANLSVILGVEALCAAQGIDFRAPLTTAPRLQAAIDALRAEVPTLDQDRYLAPDIEAAARARSAHGTLGRAAGAGVRAVKPVEVPGRRWPIVLGLPHTGTWLPDDISQAQRRGPLLADTDWHVDRLYEGLLARRHDRAGEFPPLRDRRQPPARR
jgi:hypothetical protein